MIRVYLYKGIKIMSLDKSEKIYLLRERIATLNLKIYLLKDLGVEKECGLTIAKCYNEIHVLKIQLNSYVS